MLGGLAVVLVVLAVLGVGRAEAAAHDHHAPAGHQPQAEGMAGHRHAAPAPAASADEKPQRQHQHEEGGVHHGGGCHCMSAACTSVMPVSLSELRVHMPRARHAVPAPSTALALAGVDPPAKPPRL